MSLNRLLDEDPKDSDAWKQQRSRLYKLVGISIAALTIFFVIAFLIFVDPRENNRKTEGSSEAQIEEERTATYEKLLNLREEARELTKEVEEFAERRDSQIIVSDRPRRTPPPPPEPQPQPIFIDTASNGGFESVRRTTELNYIPSGAVFQARLITPIKTSVQRSFVLAETINDYRMDQDRRIRKNSRLIGSAYLNPVLKSVVVEFDKLVTPKGRETRIDALALDNNALPEIDGLYFSDKLETYSTALAFGFLSGFADAARERETTIYGSQPEQSVSNQVLAGLSTSSFQVAEELLRDIREKAVEYVVVPAGKPVFVALQSRYQPNNQNALKGEE